MALSNWREFVEGDEWFAGRALWLWAPSWEKPRLVTADRGDDFEWFYASGPKLEDASWEFPTHCCDPMPPTPPAEQAHREPVLTTEFFGIDEQILKNVVGPLFRLLQQHSIANLSIERRGREAVLSFDGKQLLMVPKRRRAGTSDGVLGAAST